MPTFPREQGLVNLALAGRDAGVQMDALYNVQLHERRSYMATEVTRRTALYRGNPIRILHFSGYSKDDLPDLQAHYRTQ